MTRIQNGLVDINSTTTCPPSDPRTRGAKKIRQVHASDAVLFQSFFPRTTRDWNHLPTTTTSAPSLETFRSRLSCSTKCCQAASLHNPPKPATSNVNSFNLLMTPLRDPRHHILSPTQATPPAELHIYAPCRAQLLIEGFEMHPRMHCMHLRSNTGGHDVGQAVCSYVNNCSLQ